MDRTEERPLFSIRIISCVINKSKLHLDLFTGQSTKIERQPRHRISPISGRAARDEKLKTGVADNAFAVYSVYISFVETSSPCVNIRFIII